MLFVGRITRQKGIIHLVNAITDIDPASRWCSAPARPTPPRSAGRWPPRVAEVSADRRRHLDPGDAAADEVIHSTRTPPSSVSFGLRALRIINLEAMACETAVVASAVGGIPEVVVPEETGELIPLELKPGTFDPVDPAAFTRALAEGINAVALDPLSRQVRAQWAQAR